MCLTLEDQVPGGVRGRASGLKLTPLGLKTGPTDLVLPSAARANERPGQIDKTRDHGQPLDTLSGELD